MPHKASSKHLSNCLYGEKNVRIDQSYTGYTLGRLVSHIKVETRMQRQSNLHRQPDNIVKLHSVNICMEPFIFYKPLLQAPAVNKSFKLKNILICKNESYNAGEIKVLRLTEWFVVYGDFFLHCSSMRMLTGGS